MAAPGRRVQLQEAFKLALSVTLFYWLALSLVWPSPKNGVIAIAVTSLATIGGSLNKGLLRILGTAIGVVAGLVILTVFAQSRWGFMLAMSAYVIAVSYVLQSTRYGAARCGPVGPTPGGENKLTNKSQEIPPKALTLARGGAVQSTTEKGNGTSGIAALVRHPAGPRGATWSVEGEMSSPVVVDADAPPW